MESSFMNQEQVAIFSILAGILALFAWGRMRYDVVAFMGLILCVLLGLVPVQDAFSGFSHPATITVALVLILSRGLVNSGVVDLIVSRLMFNERLCIKTMNWLLFTPRYLALWLVFEKTLS